MFNQSCIEKIAHKVTKETIAEINDVINSIELNVMIVNKVHNFIKHEKATGLCYYVKCKTFILLANFKLTFN